MPFRPDFLPAEALFFWGGGVIGARPPAEPRDVLRRAAQRQRGAMAPEPDLPCGRPWATLGATAAARCPARAGGAMPPPKAGGRLRSPRRPGRPLPPPRPWTARPACRPHGINSARSARTHGRHGMRQGRRAAQPACCRGPRGAQEGRPRRRPGRVRRGRKTCPERLRMPRGPRRGPVPPRPPCRRPGRVRRGRPPGSG